MVLFFGLKPLTCPWDTPSDKFSPLPAKDWTRIRGKRLQKV
ncbi:MAG: hypothetical protein Q8S84_03435 [bacterium]|nr:hypothetical protein [bacterium]MDP3380578.1 hypothetical protein [bacterium]